MGNYLRFNVRFLQENLIRHQRMNLNLKQATIRITFLEVINEKFK